jgi:hypothetical protein
VAEVERETDDALHELGEATAAVLTERVPGLREQISFGEGKTLVGKVGVLTRLNGHHHRLISAVIRRSSIAHEN